MSVRPAPTEDHIPFGGAVVLARTRSTVDPLPPVEKDTEAAGSENDKPVS